MRICENGVYRDMTPEEEANFNAMVAPIPEYSYEERIVMRIRAKYSIDDELAILRQKDSKPEEFAEYNDYVEQIKAEERAKEPVEETEAEVTETTEE